LHPQRFLRKYKLDRVEEGTGVAHQIAGMLHAARFMRGTSVHRFLLERRWSSGSKSEPTLL
jgi:hypothetical protein